MKRIPSNLHLTIVLVASVLFAAASVNVASAATVGSPTTVVRGGLVGYWSFDGSSTHLGINTVDDLSGGGNSMTIHNMSTATAPVIGRVGQALLFDDADDYLENASVSSDLNITGDITISVWIKRPAGMPRTYGGIFTKSIDSVAADYELYIDGSPQSGNDDRLGFWTSAGGGQNVYNDTPITDTNWHHVIFTRNGGASAFYLDGVPDGGAGLTNTFTNGASRVTIGTDGPTYLGGASNFGGMIDEVRIYNRSLSITEIKTLYRAGQAKLSKTPTTSVKNGLVGRWTFDGPDFTDKVYDKSGQGNHGYLENSATTTVKTKGKSGQAINLDGINDDVVLGDINALDGLTAMTASAWVKTTSFSSERHIISKSGCVGGVNGGVFEMFGPSTVGDPIFGIYKNGGGPDYYNAVSSVRVDDGKWHLVTGTYDGTAVRIYIDGVQTGSTAAAGVTMPSTSNQVYIGDCDINATWDGSIDDVRTYNRALTAAEVKQLYNEGVGVSVGRSQSALIPSGLIGYWSFNGADFTDAVYDRSGQGNKGYVIGIATTSVKSAGKMGQGFNLDGGDGTYIDMGDVNTFDGLTALTASAWVKTTASGERHVFDKSACNGASNGGVFELLMRYSVEGKLAALIYPLNSVPQDYYVIEGSTDINDGRWHHVAETYDGSNLRIYVDGISDATQVSAPGLTLSSGNTTVQIGGDCNASVSNYTWDGSIDEVRMYNRALSAAEIKRLYQTGR